MFERFFSIFLWKIISSRGDNKSWPKNFLIRTVAIEFSSRSGDERFGGLWCRV